jgi:hypothetical protein
MEQGGVRFLDVDGSAVGIIRADVEISRLPRSDSEVTLADVEAIKLPFTVNGRQLYENSERAVVTKAIIALLKKKQWASHREILATLRRLNIDITGNHLSVILAKAKGLFYSCRAQTGNVRGWSMNNYCYLEKQGNNEIE